MAMTWTEEDYKAAQARYGVKVGSKTVIQPKPNKHRAKRQKIDGINFPSKVQTRYYLHLKELQAAGEIEYFLRDVRFDVLGARAEIDFMIVSDVTDGPELFQVTRYVDVKGSNAPDVMRNFRRNKKQIEVAYPVTIEVVRWIKGEWVYE